MLALVKGALTDGKAAGFGLTRFWVKIEWALEEHLEVHDLIEHETRPNYLFPTYDDVVGCTYALTRVSACVVIDILLTQW
jgi:MEDS: MEthanogen/methylotroph, DcmR Sensory domain